MTAMADARLCMVSARSDPPVSKTPESIVPAAATATAEKHSQSIVFRLERIHRSNPKATSPQPRAMKAAVIIHPYGPLAYSLSR